MELSALSLRDLNLMVRHAIEEADLHAVWVTGELAEGRTAYNGHFYGELVEKDQRSEAVVARARLTCWAGQWRGLRDYFIEETGQDLKPGMSLMLCVEPTFHEQYGYSLQILDIQPQFTLGGQALKRRQILAQLEQDGILHDNQELSLPLLTQRIAVISSASAAGWGDFQKQLLHNDSGIRFTVQLFPAVMQGQHVPESVAAALNEIADQWEQWDAVCIIRGGGASTDLSDFDSYPLAACIAQFPLPVITGIGHDRDETVLDYVAHTQLKTPTAVAAFFVNRMEAQLLRVMDLQQRIPQAARMALQRQTSRLGELQRRIPQAVRSMIQRGSDRMARLELQLRYATRNKLQREQHRHELLAQRLQALDPALPLKRGYSIVRCNGQIITKAAMLKPGDAIELQMQDGTRFASLAD